MKKPRELHVGISPITNTIYVGHVLRDGQTWGEGKQDVTGEAIAVAAQFVLAEGVPVIVTANGVPKYEIWVRELGESVE